MRHAIPPLPLTGRAHFAVVAADLLVTIWIVFAIVTPVHSSDSGEDDFVTMARYWLAAFAPEAHATFALQHARWFNPVPAAYCEGPEDEHAAWLRVFHRTTARTDFGVLTRHANPRARLYAIAGIARAAPEHLGAYLPRYRSDTATVTIYALRGSPVLRTLRVRDAVSDSSARAWGLVLAQPLRQCP